VHTRNGVRSANDQHQSSLIALGEDAEAETLGTAIAQLLDVWQELRANVHREGDLPFCAVKERRFRRGSDVDHG
jgi:hypothetical protein